MKILHTSDWHLGRTLYGKRCHDEFRSFLDWLLLEIEQQQVDCLLVAGDVFDSSSPSNSILGLYYSFLTKVTKTCCRHVVITGGNHDSPSLLNAPRELLRHFDVSVIGSVPEQLEEEVLLLKSPEGNPELVVCAVPYLRDRDVRSAEAGETYEEKSRKLITGIEDHYQRVVSIALGKISDIPNVPIIAMGHLFATGGKIAENNEIRDLYVGTLAHVHSSLFPEEIDYMALGHLHIAQKINDDERIQYSGSPLQLSFGKGNSNKSVTLITTGSELATERVRVPPFLNLRTISGDRDSLVSSIKSFIDENVPIFLEAIYTGDNITPVAEELERQTKNSPVDLIRIIHRRANALVISENPQTEPLEELSEVEVFRRCLAANSIEENDKNELESRFLQILDIIRDESEEDSNS